MKTKKLFIAILALSAFLLTSCGQRNSTYDYLAQCLTDKGVELYGAFWCSNCQKQKAMFGDSADLLPYIECDANGKNANPEACNAKNITAYPTWIFPDGTTKVGVQSLEDISALSSCPLPGEESVMFKAE
ncbi:MAG: hypothetical protein WC897_00010 [Candidatus Gracilibacteria bacterium]